MLKKTIICICLAMILILMTSACTEIIPENTSEAIEKEELSGDVPLLLPDDRGKLLGASYSFGSFNEGQWDYRIAELDGKLYFTAEGSNGVELDIHAEVSIQKFEEFEKIIESNHIQNWHGFNECDDEVLDGYGFTLTIDFEEGSLTASGYESYPENYEVIHESLVDYFEQLADSISSTEG